MKLALRQRHGMTDDAIAPFAVEHDAAAAFRVSRLVGERFGNGAIDDAVVNELSSCSLWPCYSRATALSWTQRPSLTPQIAYCHSQCRRGMPSRQDRSLSHYTNGEAFGCFLSSRLTPALCPEGDGDDRGGQRCSSQAKVSAVILAYHDLAYSASRARVSQVASNGLTPLDPSTVTILSSTTR